MSSLISNRSFDANSYKYGFNGKENDNETVGTGEGTQDYGMRIYNPALGRFLSVDPISKEYPELTPYQFASNKPITSIDLDGLEELDVVKKYDVEKQLTSEQINDIPKEKQDPNITREKGKVRITEIRPTNDKPLITVTYSDEVPKNLKSEYDKEKVNNGNKPVTYIKVSYGLKKAASYGRVIESNIQLNNITDLVENKILSKNPDRKVEKMTFYTSSDYLTNGVGKDVVEDYKKQYPDAEISIKTDKKKYEKAKNEKNGFLVIVKFKANSDKD